MKKPCAVISWFAFSFAVGIGLAAIAASPARAQAGFPSHPVRIIVPFSAGGSTDLVARSLAEGLGKLWQQSVVVENREGASGMIGARVVAEAAADGYTLLFGTQTTQAVLPYIAPKMPYNAQKAFVPVTELVAIGQLLSVPASSPFRSLQDLVTYAKAHPGELTYGGGHGATTDMTMRLLMSKARIDLLGIPYKGSALAMNDLLGGRLDAMFDVIMTSLPHVQAGKLRPLAVTSAQRYALLPDVPTVSELGYPGFETDVWFGLFAPAGTPPDIVRKISEDSREVLAEAARRKTMVDAGFRIVASDPATFARRVQAEKDTWSRIVKEFDIKMQ